MASRWHSSRDMSDEGHACATSSLWMPPARPRNIRRHVSVRVLARVAPDGRCTSCGGDVRVAWAACRRPATGPAPLDGRRVDHAPRFRPRLRSRTMARRGPLGESSPSPGVGPDGRRRGPVTNDIATPTRRGATPRACVAQRSFTSGWLVYPKDFDPSAVSNGLWFMAGPRDGHPSWPDTFGDGTALASRGISCSSNSRESGRAESFTSANVKDFARRPRDIWPRGDGHSDVLS